MKTSDDVPGTVIDPPAILTTSEVSRLLGVSPNTVTRWAREGRLPCRLTLGGHHRFERRVIEGIRDSLNRAGTDGAALTTSTGHAKNVVSSAPRPVEKLV
jgi:excisionase family DNA binding protein